MSRRQWQMYCYNFFHCSACAFDVCLLNYLLTYLLTYLYISINEDERIYTSEYLSERVLIRVGNKDGCTPLD